MVLILSQLRNGLAVLVGGLLKLGDGLDVLVNWAGDSLAAGLLSRIGGLPCRR